MIHLNLDLNKVILAAERKSLRVGFEARKFPYVSIVW